MYDIMRYKLHWPDIAKEVYTGVTDCCREGLKRANKTQTVNLEFLSARGLLESIAMDAFGPLSKLTNVLKFVLIMTDRHSKLTLVLTNLKTSAMHFAFIFLNH